MFKRQFIITKRVAAVYGVLAFLRIADGCHLARRAWRGAFAAQRNAMLPQGPIAASLAFGAAYVFLRGGVA